MPPCWFAAVVVVVLGYPSGGTSAVDDPKLKLSACPAAVRKTFEAEAPGSKIEDVSRRQEEDDEVVFWAEAVVAGKTYEIGVLEDGTLSEMNLSVDGDGDIPIEKCPEAVRATFQAEAFGQKVATVGKDLKYGELIYEAVVEHKGKMYEIVVAEDGTLIEKVLVIDEQEVELAACPPPVQAALKKHARGGTIDGITRSAGIGKPTFEAELEHNGKVYLVEVDEAGVLISKSLQAGQD